MYISSFAIRNIKCFEDATIVFSGKPGDHAGWHVLLGINGTGKSTLLQAMALAMLGPVSGGRLLQQPTPWVRAGATYGEVQAGLTTGRNDSLASGAPRKKPYDASLLVTGADAVTVGNREFAVPQVALSDRSLGRSLNSGPYSNKHGWFSAGYGPFRRLTGSGGEDDVSLQYGQGREARHLTLFRESAALTRCEKWLISLHSQSIDPALANRERLEGQLADARRLIDGLLPSAVRIDTITAKEVTFKTNTGVKVLLSQLSDGYRSFLALAIDLLRHIIESDEYGKVTIDAEGWSQIDSEGVVLIDEADAHLHPTWQRDIGLRMVQTFPRIQFIVSSHSAFVAQAARENGLFVVRTKGKRVIIEPRDSVRGWKADQILLSPLFGLESTRDPETERLLRRQAELRAAASLKGPAQHELAGIERTLRKRLTAPGDTLKDRERERQMQLFIDDRLAKLAAGGVK